MGGEKEHRPSSETAVAEEEVAPVQDVAPSNAVIAAEVATEVAPVDETPHLTAAEQGATELTPVEAATERMAALAEDRRDPVDGTVDPVAVQAEAAAFAEALAGLDPEQQAEFLATVGAQTATEMLKAAQEAGDPATVQAVVDALLSSSEGLDDASLAMMVESVIAGGSPEVAQALWDGLAAGTGANLAVALSYHQGASASLGHQYASGVDGVMSMGDLEFEHAANAADTVRAELAAGAARMRELGLTDEEVATWEAEYLAEHQHVLDEYEARAEWYASTLDARAIAHEEGGEWAEGHYSFDMVDRLAASEAGGREAAEAVFAAGEGESTWLDQLPPEERERWVTRGAMEGVAALASTGDLEGIDQLLSGLQNVSPEDAEAVQVLRDKLAGIDPSLEGDARNAAIAELFSGEGIEADGITARLGAAAVFGISVAALGEVSGDTFDSGASALGNGFKRLGAGLSALGRLTPDELGRYQENLIPHLGLDAAEFLSTFIKGSGVAAGVGAVIGVLDAALYISEGNYEAAGLALLPTLGAGIGSLFGPLGTVIGGVAGAALSALLGALGFGTPDQIQAITEPLVIRALTDRGWPPGMAAEHAALLASDGFGPQLQAAAAALGYTADELLTALAAAPPEYVSKLLMDVQMCVEIREDGSGGREVEVNDWLARMYGVVTPEMAKDDENLGWTMWNREQEIMRENQEAWANG